MPEQLSLRLRPKSLGALIGQEKVVARIKRRLQDNRIHKGWLFKGPLGTGKTTIARILAVSLQCTHQEEAGAPCKVCWRKYRQNKFPIIEVNTSDKTKVEDMRDLMNMSDYDLLGIGRYRVFILDESHQLSNHAQNLLLKYFEDSSAKNVFIMCSTRSDKILGTLRSRCKEYTMRDLTYDGTKDLIRRILKREKSELDGDLLADELQDKGIKSPRLIVNAVEDLMLGSTIEEAASVDLAGDVSTKALCRTVIKAQWNEVSKLLMKATDNDVPMLRGALIGYLTTMLLESPEVDDRTEAVGKAIRQLVYMPFVPENKQLSAFAAELSVCVKILGR